MPMVDRAARNNVMVLREYFSQCESFQADIRWGIEPTRDDRLGGPCPSFAADDQGQTGLVSSVTPVNTYMHNIVC